MTEHETTTTDPEMLADYQTWKAMGQGGTSLNWTGYLSQLSAQKMIALDDTLSPEVYSQPAKYATNWTKANQAQKLAANTSFLREPLPQRRGPRARALKFVYPQRERLAAEHLDPGIRQAYQEVFERLGEMNRDHTEWKTSLLEKQGKALFLQQHKPLSPLNTPAQREICHIHASDMSGHVTLSFADAQEVIAKGWGERHRLSGTAWLPLGYTMLYVPRSVDETEVLGRILQAGVEFVSSG